MVSSVWPKTKMRLEQIGLELSLDNEQPVIQQATNVTENTSTSSLFGSSSATTTATTTTSTSASATAATSAANATTTTTPCPPSPSFVMNTCTAAATSSRPSGPNFSLTFDTSSRRQGFAAAAAAAAAASSNDCELLTRRGQVSPPSHRSSSSSGSGQKVSKPKTLASNHSVISPISPGTMSTRINSEFKKNVFFASPDEQPITTSLPPEEVFEELDILGTGSSGNVLKMRHKPSGKICAVKQMRRTFNDEENKRIYMDLQVVLQCECDDIVRCCGYFIKESEVWICMELMTTCFDKVLRTRKRELPETFVGAIAVASVKALRYLKDKHNIIHRDVKPSNILINDRGQIKLCDFGISGRLIDSLARTRAAGCVPYMAPERIDFGNHSYDIRADVWSLGITLYELATGKSPYAGCHTDFDILVKVVKDDPPSLPSDMDFSDEFRSFIKACLTKNCKQRPKYKQLIEHEFILRHLKTVVSLSELDTG